MNNENSIYKKLYHGGFAAYGILFIFSIVFYKERTIFADIAFHLFHIIRNNDFAIQVFRYGAVVTQVFPLLARKLSLPLPAIMIIYSAGVMLYYITCYWVIGSLLKNYRMALVLLLSQLLFLSNAFYWMQAELQQGLAFMLVVFAWLNNQQPGKMNILSYTVSLVLLVFLNFFHPLLVVPAMFLCLYFFINRATGFDRRIIIMAAIVMIAMHFIKRQFFVNQYDQDASKGFMNFVYLYPHYFGIASNRKFLADCLDMFYWIPITSIFVCVVYLYKKRWLSFLLFMVFCVGFLFLVNVSFPHNSEVDFYMENLYLPFAIIICVPLVFDVFPLFKKRRFITMAVTIIVITGLIRIYNKHERLTVRLNWERKFLAEHIDHKLLVYDKEVPMDTLNVLWGTPYEFWLLSTTEFGKTASIVMNEHVAKLLWYKWENREFITTIERIDYRFLPPPYFMFRDSITHYDILSAYKD